MAKIDLEGDREGVFIRSSVLHTTAYVIRATVKADCWTGKFTMVNSCIARERDTERHGGSFYSRE